MEREEEEEEETTYKSSMYIYYLVGVTCLGSFFTGYQIGVFNQSQHVLHNIMNIEDDDDKASFDGLITSLIPLGGLIGAYMSHHLLKIYSRKNGLIFCDIIGIIGKILSSFSLIQSQIINFYYSLFRRVVVIYLIIRIARKINVKIEILFEKFNNTKLMIYYFTKNVGCILQVCLFSEYLFIFGRFVCGLACGLNSSLVSLYIMEVAPIQMRQQVSTLPVFGLNLGTLIAYCTGIVFTSDDYTSTSLMYIFGFPILICIVRTTLLRFFLSADSPYFFFENGELFEAKAQLGIIYKEEHIDHIYHDYHQAFIEKQKNQETYFSVFNYQNKKRMIVAITMMYFLHFVGVSAVMFYSTKLFSRATNMNRNLSIYLTVISGLFPILCSFISGYLSTKFGRKTLLYWGMNGQIIITLTFALLSYWDMNDSHEKTPRWLSILLVINVIIARSYVVSTYAPNSLAYTSDICCDKGISIAFMAYWFFQGIVGYLFPYALFYIGYPLTFIFFSLNSVFGSLFVQKNVKETQGLTRIEIMLLYNPEYEQQINQKIKEMNSLKQSLVFINNIDARQSLMQSTRMEQEMTNVTTVC